MSGPYSPEEMMSALDKEGTPYTVTVEVAESRLYPNSEVLHHGHNWICVRYGEHETWIAIAHIIAIAIRVESHDKPGA